LRLLCLIVNITLAVLARPRHLVWLAATVDRLGMSNKNSLVGDLGRSLHANRVHYSTVQADPGRNGGHQLLHQRWLIALWTRTPRHRLAQAKQRTTTRRWLRHFESDSPTGYRFHVRGNVRALVLDGQGVRTAVKRGELGGLHIDLPGLLNMQFSLGHLLFDGFEVGPGRLSASATTPALVEMHL